MWWLPLATTAASLAADKYNRDKERKERGKQTDPFSNVSIPDLENVEYKSPEYAGNIIPEEYKAEGYSPAIRNPANTTADKLQQAKALGYLAQTGEAEGYSAANFNNPEI